jgi:hypothetical protein
VTATLYSAKSARPLEEVNRCSTREKESFRLAIVSLAESCGA